MPILINEKPLREYIAQGNRVSNPKKQLPIKTYEEALQLKENYSLVELARMWGITKEGAASRVRRARMILDAR